MKLDEFVVVLVKLKKIVKEVNTIILLIRKIFKISALSKTIILLLVFVDLLQAGHPYISLIAQLLA